MISAKNVAAIVSLLLVASCAAVPADPADVAREVADRERAFARTMADRDYPSFAGFLAEEAIFFNGDDPIRGRTAIAEA